MPGAPDFPAGDGLVGRDPLRADHHQLLALTNAGPEAALRELTLIASVSHPSVVQFKDYGWHEGRLYFAMPWYRGRTLTAAAPGRVDSPPTSTRSAPSASRVRACARARSGSRKAPPYA